MTRKSPNEEKQVDNETDWILTVLIKKLVRTSELKINTCLPYIFYISVFKFVGYIDCVEFNLFYLASDFYPPLVCHQKMYTALCILILV